MVFRRICKKRIFSGDVCEQLVFPAADGASLKTVEPRPRFKSKEERERFMYLRAKRRHARIVNANFSPSSCYSTLTFDNEWEVHTFDDAKVLRERFVKKLRAKYPDCKLIIYMGRGKGTRRIHFHMLSEGVPPEFIESKWQYGSVVRIERMREHNFYNGVDHGRDYTGLANYLFDHWTPEQGERSHRYRPTKNLVKPDEEKATVCKRKYTESKPPAAPKGFVLVESAADTFGHLYFKYVRKPEPVKRARREKKKM